MPVVWFLWVLVRIAIAACDLAEVVGSAIALQLLFGIPLVWGCAITALDVLAVLYLQNKGFRYIEALVVTLIATIGRACFAAEIFLGRSPALSGRSASSPACAHRDGPQMLYVASASSGRR
jgi:manganese transport protein